MAVGVHQTALLPHCVSDMNVLPVCRPARELLYTGGG
jgi:hypothetical protein